MGLMLDPIYGQTSLDEDEIHGLKIKSISTKLELDELEQKNIEDAFQNLIGSRVSVKKLLSDTYIRKVHKLMFSDVWKWAGEFRKTNKNLGIEAYKIPIELKKLCDDTLYWIQENSFQPDEIAIRFKHRLVSIHCFANGNGRHSRFMADLIAEHVYQNHSFTWGSTLNPKDVREQYLFAVKAADRDDYKALVHFARS